MQYCFPSLGLNGLGGTLRNKRFISCIIKSQLFFVNFAPKIEMMSQAFIKEQDDEWLHDISPTLAALTVYLSRQNNGIRVYEKKVYHDVKTNREVHEMSNGLSYSKDDSGKWMVV